MSQVQAVVPRGRVYTIGVACALIGTAYSTLCPRWSWLAEAAPLELALRSFFVLGPFVGGGAWFATKAAWAILPALWVGIVVGVVIDVARDPMERNLFPLEIAWWCITSLPGVCAAVLLGVIVGRRR